MWREVDQAKLLILTLSVEEAERYEKLVNFKLPKVRLTDSRNMDWIFTLRGNDNTIRFSLVFLLLFLFTFPSHFICIFVIQFRLFVSSEPDEEFS